MGILGKLKKVVYSKIPTTRENMMKLITLACHSIPRNVLLSTVLNVEFNCVWIIMDRYLNTY